jgi:predicted HTH transcriptional regulator
MGRRLRKLPHRRAARHEQDEYSSIETLCELTVNAVIHRDWNHKGQTL